MSVPTAHFSTVDCSISNNGTPQKKRTKRDYALMIKVIRNEYPNLSNGAKYFYEHLADCDFADKITKVCKGYLFHKVERLAIECHCGEGSVIQFSRFVHDHVWHHRG